MLLVKNTAIRNSCYRVVRLVYTHLLDFDKSLHFGEYCAKSSLTSDRLPEVRELFGKNVLFRYRQRSRRWEPLHGAAAELDGAVPGARNHVPGFQGRPRAGRSTLSRPIQPQTRQAKTRNRPNMPGTGLIALLLLSDEILSVKVFTFRE
jgi:hypothetical protein